MRTKSQMANLVLGATIITTLGISAWDEAAAQTANNVICNGCVGSRDIATGGVKGIDVLNGSLTGTDVKNGSLSGADIADGSVGPADLAPAAKPGGAAKNEAVNEGTSFVSPEGEVITSVTLNLPAPGQVIVTATGTADVAATYTILCYLGKNVKIGMNYVTGRSAFFAPSTDLRVPLALTDIFVETAAGQQTYKVYCQGTTGEAFLNGASIVAIYVPSALEVLP